MRIGSGASRESGMGIPSNGMWMDMVLANERVYCSQLMDKVADYFWAMSEIIDSAKEVRPVTQHLALS